MGSTIDKAEYSDKDYAQFSERLLQNVKALRLLLQQDGFGCGQASFGAELELYIIDQQDYPLSESMASRLFVAVESTCL